MNIQKVSINKLNFADYNPRRDLQPDDEEYKKIKKSIEKFGYVEPVIVNTKDKTYKIISGHQRVKVLKDLAYKEIDCVLVSLDENDEKALNIALNKISGEWDNEKLQAVLKELKDFDQDQFFLTGFEDKEFQKLEKEFGEKHNNNKEVLDKNENFNEGKAKEEAQKKTITKKGYLYQLGNNFLLCGNSTKSDNLKILIDKIDIKNTLVFTDPPYGINIVGKDKQIGAGKLAKAKKYDEIIGDDTIETAKNNYNMCMDLKFNKFIIWGGNYFFEFLPLDKASWIVWDKRGDIESNNFGDGEIAYSSLNHPIRIYKHIWNGMSQEGKQETRVHPTQKPVKMIHNVIKSFMGKDLFNSVIDFFGGSGSTLIACNILNLPCFVVELSEIYCDVIIKRYIEYKSGKPDDVFLIDKDNKKIPWSKLVGGN
ncbi:MAG: ParB N-terminal domain-containing protein [Candidatus Odinarchaeota archaeon]